MTHEERIELEMRLGAIEYMLSRVMVALSRAAGITQKQFDEALEKYAQDAAKQTFPVGDPALSDLASAEWEKAI